MSAGLLDMGNDRYAVYAHLQPGSLLVKKGDRVRRGQVLALVGNTGNSSEPHLHFHVADRARSLDAEGTPYALASFELEAGPELVSPAIKSFGGSLAFEPSDFAKWVAAPARHREKEMPLLNEIVRFCDR